MKERVPVWAAAFTCLAGACKHTCCKGWEIAIDEESYQRYLSMEGPMGEKLRACMAEGEEGAYFLLDAQERCPLLTEDGLCTLIQNCGEESLCAICRDHPRFRAFFSDCTEIGLGLCCEAAARRIVSFEGKFSFIEKNKQAQNDLSGKEEETLFYTPEEIEREREVLALRDTCLALVTDRRWKMHERVQKLIDTFALPACWEAKAQAQLLFPLERLDQAWDEQLLALASYQTEQAKEPLPEAELALEQILVYLLTRHLPSALWDQRPYLTFCVFAYQVIVRLFQMEKKQSGQLSLDAMVEIVRLFSSEIEYSDENMDTILESLG